MLYSFVYFLVLTINLLTYIWCYKFYTPYLPAKTSLQSSSRIIEDASIEKSSRVNRFQSAKTILKGKFCSIKANESVESAVQAMNEYRKGSALVLDDDDNLMGIFTERDFVSNFMDSETRANDISIQKVMTPRDKLITALGSTSLNECRQLMINNRVRHLPLLDDATGMPIGVISMRDILLSLQKEDQALSSARFTGETLSEIQEKAKEQANILALAASAENQKQDVLRSSFVVAIAVVSAALLQGEWIQGHEYIAMISTFALGYLGIVFETYFEFNKAGIALLMSTALWVIFAGSEASGGIDASGNTGLLSALNDLGEKVSEVSEVVYFILGAMTIVEIIDAHQGFKVVTDSIKATNKRALMRIIAVLSFFLSGILDNLTTTIVMVSLVKKLLPNVEDRKLFGAMIVIAANAGGAWTPIGDVTTTMLWINGQISVLPTMTGLFIPSIISMLVSAFFLEKSLPEDASIGQSESKPVELAPRGRLVFITGILGLLSVPVFKTMTGLPPYLGMLASLGVMWSLTDAIHAGEGKDREELMAPAALKKIDTSGVLFFLGILLSVGALDSAGILKSLAEVLDKTFPNEQVIATLIGFASALIDNVPLVAATMGMYSTDVVPMDSSLWQLIAYCAGTGGSLLVIGSAAGVALMGLENVDFLWYVKKVTGSALAGYLIGLGAYIAQSSIMNAVQSPTLSLAAAAVGGIQ